MDGQYPRLTLRPLSIEKVFTDCIMDTGVVVVLDGVDDHADGFTVRCHDMHGLLPEIEVAGSGDTFRDKETLGIETCKLVAIARMREDLFRSLPRCEFLPPTRADGVRNRGAEDRVADVAGGRAGLSCSVS